MSKNAYKYSGLMKPHNVTIVALTNLQNKLFIETTEN